MAHGKAEGGPELPTIDVSERAGHHTGNPQSISSRLFMQLLVFQCEGSLMPSEAVGKLTQRLRGAGCPAVLYADVSDPRGIGLLTYSEEPADFVDKVRPAVLDEGLAQLRPRNEFAMLGRTYATGYEPDLRYWLLDRPRENVMNDAWPWAVW